MIAYIHGKVAFKCPTYVIIETAGVGYQIHISLNTYSKIPDSTSTGGLYKLHTYLSIKEDAHTLYGFADEGEKRLFIHLISVSGIGPNTARMMLSSITPQEIEQAIANGDVPQIQRIKGIGPKSAQRLVLELQDKLKKEVGNSLIAIPQNNSIRDEALTALVMLGFVKNTAEKVVDSILKRTDDLTVEGLIKESLKNL
ncbi:Holliday junction branch migration protein RuvA [Solitalea canadensis]|uniref:Holliday junction branch migration complex subunit RuvA n=1 Tax=Solitalea canadensis (strain ATCC 29591 / DSM 3403 / JCM 21819 / LMG 8368 / NBRC 15130 / NCIMB 12057 / USAM 9D) TaxID=929556 RepID=H8KMT6_SOLCM|nr:Holliday junction branch migration protein RuvA [Solitalea canadensis]AFD09339.1 Holliday junction DNA helicase, RuvA subunit [Solitalea canadensis DSM 3403]